MFTSLALTSLLAFSLLVNADPDPTTPGPGAVYNSGSQCPISWNVDSTGTWKTMNIQLMTGDNLDMVTLTSVGTVDGTNPSTNTFSWTCPEVNPNSAIYFYQFTSPGSKNTLWTTRFAIASDSGTTTPPANATQPNGQAIPWGVGALANPADAKSLPSGSSGSASASSSSSASVSGTVSSSTTSAVSSPITASSSDVAPSSSSLAGTNPSTNRDSSGTTSGSPSSASGSTGGNASNANAAMAALSIDGRIFQAAIALGVAAFGFTALL